MSIDTKRSLCYGAVFLTCALMGIVWGVLLSFPASVIASILSGGIIGYNARKIVNLIVDDLTDKK